MDQTLNQVRNRAHNRKVRRVMMTRNDCATMTISIDAKGNVLDDFLRPTGQTVAELRDDGFQING